MPEINHLKRGSEAFFGRRKGKHLRQNQRKALDYVLTELRLDLSQPAPDDIAQLWPEPVRSTRLEIGFGGGEHLIHRARNMPDTGFIGIEPFVNSMAKLAQSIHHNPLDNLRLYDDDATLVLDWLPENSIDHIDLLYPDPWPKKRHWKRRFVSRINLDRFARVLRAGGKFCFASDIDSYVNWTLQHIKAHPDFCWMASCSQDWDRAWDDWPSTRYEAKALREGREPTYLDFEYMPKPR